MELRGRCQQISTVLRERGPQSIRKLAQATGLPKSNVERHCERAARARIERELYQTYVQRRDQPPVLVLYDVTSSYFEGAGVIRCPSVRGGA